MKIGDLNIDDVKKFMRPENGSIYPTLGGDPEFFVAVKKDGTILNSDRFFPGKHSPIEVGECSDPKKNSKLYFDGIQAELAPGYSTCRETLAYNLRTVLQRAFEKIGPENEIVLKPAVKMKKSILDIADPEARIFGCMPDFNAYTRSVNTPEMDASSHMYRYAGGHIHLGVSLEYAAKGSPEKKMVEDQEKHLEIIKALDLLVSLVTLPLDNADGSSHRRSKYGKAGCFRPTPYGVEYRTPSCWWLKSPATLSLVYGMARLAWNMVVKNTVPRLMEIAKIDEQEVRGIIDEGDIKSAYSVWEKIRPVVAVSEAQGFNPLHAGACESVNGFGGLWGYNTIEVLKLGKKYTTSSPGMVHNIAVFEYLLKNGLDPIVSAVESEWLLSNPRHTYLNGFTKSALSLVGNEDFIKFQNSLMKEMW